MRSFEFSALPWNIIFACGSLSRLPAELKKLSLSRALILSTPEQSDDAAKIAAILGSAAAGIFDQAVMHVPSETIARAQELVKRRNADCTVSIGGGSTTGLGKALALKDDLPNIAIPTTYAGSEMTNIWGVTEAGRKTTGRDNRVVPVLTIYDPELTLTLPPAISATSGINALAHAVVNVTDGNNNPIIALMAEEAIHTLSMNLPQVVKEPDNLAFRTEALYGTCLAGAALGAGTTGIHHRLCHTLGGSFDTPHALTHTVILPYAVAFNAGAAPEGTQRVADALGVDDAAGGIYDLGLSVGVTMSIKSLGMKEEDIDRAAALATEQPCPNPAAVTFEGVKRLLMDAFAGERPSCQ
ncbi:MAG: maleylacetate reductase [Gammaproteobacteria bacterium]